MRYFLRITFEKENNDDVRSMSCGKVNSKYL